MTVVCPFAAWKPVGNHGGPMADHLGLVLHVQEGNNSLAGWFNNPASGASSTWWVAKDGVLEQYVDANICAWAQGQGNSTYNSIETEGYHDEPLTAAQESAIALLYQWGAEVYGWAYALAEIPGQDGFGWHGMGGQAWGGHTGCPGDLRSSRRGPILDLAFGGAAPEPEPEAAEMIAPPCTFTMADQTQQAFYVDDGGVLVHCYARPGRAWVKENLSGGWDPDSGLAHDVAPGGADQVWGVRADGTRAQVYWSGTRWVLQPLP